MPVLPSALERFAILRLGLGPAPMLDAVSAAGFRALHLGVALGVFDAVGTDRAAAREVASRIRADPAATRLLLDALVAIGYLAREGDAYVTTAPARRWLLRTSPIPMGDAVRFYAEVVFPYWDAFAMESVRHGRPSTPIYRWCDGREGAWELMQSAFRSFAALSADELVARVRLEGGGRLVDVGGGHGLYAARLCAASPGWSATVFDAPGALASAGETAKREGVEARLATRAGDYLSDDLGSGYGLALLANVVHGHEPAENARLVARVRDALAPGGRVVVVDQLSRGPFVGGASRAIADVFPWGLNYHVTMGARAYAGAEVAAWLRAAGFEAVEIASFRKTPGLGLVTARRPR